MTQIPGLDTTISENEGWDFHFKCANNLNQFAGFVVQNPEPLLPGFTFENLANAWLYVKCGWYCANDGNAYVLEGLAANNLQPPLNAALAAGITPTTDLSVRMGANGFAKLLRDGFLVHSCQQVQSAEFPLFVGVGIPAFAGQITDMQINNLPMLW